MGCFATLPVDLVSEILSRTSPPDVSRFAVISKKFNSAAEFTVWDKFLPSDWPEILSTAVSPVVYATTKELYMRLCHYPILLDAGRLSFSLERKSGKKCYMLCARELGIAWGDDDRYWNWTEYPGSRFSEVAHLKVVCWLDIRGKINTRKLSSNTTYGVYLVFKLGERCRGLGSANAVVRFVDNEEDADAERRAGVVHLQQPGELPSRRSDGWMEIEMGSFYNDKGDDGEAEGRLMEIRRLNGKYGLIVEGIEFRPNDITPPAAA